MTPLKVINDNTVLHMQLYTKWNHFTCRALWYIKKCGMIKYTKYKYHTDLVCSCVLQWGFHSLWISADLKMCWTTRATSTSTQRRVSQWEYGRPYMASFCVHLSASGLENTTSTCIFGTSGVWLNRASIYSFSSTRPTQKIDCILKHKRIWLCCSLFLLSPSLSLCLIGIHSLPANGRRPWGKALSGTGRLWETAVLLLSISMETLGPGGMRVAG